MTEKCSAPQHLQDKEAILTVQYIAFVVWLKPKESEHMNVYEKFTQSTLMKHIFIYCTTLWSMFICEELK